MAKVKCSCCGGTGRRDLSRIYAATLQLLRKHIDMVSGASLAIEVGCKATAMNNRLAALERHGLAVSIKYGCMRLYRAKVER